MAKLSYVLEHLGIRGFITREKWNGHLVLYFGMDNVPWLSQQMGNAKSNRIWSPCLDDIKADDWIKLPYFWDGPKDNFLPFDRNDSTLERLSNIWATEVARRTEELLNTTSELDEITPNLQEQTSLKES